ncbi:MAG TPA: HupE/UreJ family protein [Verrucomicrobiae bacterium]|nr:HupE/UreJ family protein [Verrucomicrobiae bacterium]
MTSLIQTIARIILRTSLCLAFALIIVSAHAHRASDSYLNLRAEGSTVTGQWDIALRDIEHVIPLDANDDGDITRGEVLSRRPEIARYAAAHLQVRTGDTALQMRVAELLVEDFSDGTYAVLRFALEGGGLARIVQVDYRAFFDLDPQHRGLMRLESGGRIHSAIFSPEKPSQHFELATPSGWQQFIDFGREGVWHIWIGFDHILFLLALLLPSVLRRGSNGWEVADGFRPAFVKVLKIVTAFTIAHSITLSLATLDLVRLPSRLVEATIAASVVLAALNNIRPIFPERGWIVAFAFGLIHGFGFANVLADLGLTNQTLALALVGFNVGVEIGQLAIVAVFLPLAFNLRSSWVYQKLTFRLGSAMIAVLAATWMMERIGDFKVLPF